MKKTWITIVVIVIIIVLGLWIWSANKNSSMENTTPTTTGQNQTPASSSENMSMASTSPVLTVSNNANLGDFLVATNGMTLYTYGKDKPGQSSACTGGCATAWPPYIVTGDIPVGNGVNGTVGTSTRADGSLQLTYGGLPLYYYGKDMKPGDTTGQGIGGVWYVVQP